MKKLLFLLSITSIIVLSSCGSDDSTALVNELFFDGTSLMGENGIAVDVGSSDQHYEFDFGISDGDLAYNSSSGSFQFSTSSSFVVTFGAASFGSNQFNTGTFEFRSVIDDVPENSYFFSGTFIDIENSMTLSVTDGTITISGSSPDYALEFDLILTGGKTLTGAFVGTFELE